MPGLGLGNWSRRAFAPQLVCGGFQTFSFLSDSDAPTGLYMVGCPTVCHLCVAQQRQHWTHKHEASRRLANCLLSICPLVDSMAPCAGKREYRCIRIANRIIRRVCYLCLGGNVHRAVSRVDAEHKKSSTPGKGLFFTCFLIKD